jgi:hypothetical protein
LPNNDKTVFSEDLGFCIPAWKNPSRMCGCKWGLLKVRERKYKGNIVGYRWSLPAERKHAFLFYKSLH